MGDLGNGKFRDTTTIKQGAVKSDDVPTFNKENRDREHAVFLENIKNKESKRILIIGEQGVGKSSFVNSASMAMTGRYKYLAITGLKGERMGNFTIDLRRYTPDEYCPVSLQIVKAELQKNLPVFIDVIGFDDNLSNRLVEANIYPNTGGADPTTPNFGNFVKSVNSVLMEYILRGRIPHRCNLLEFQKGVIRGDLEEMEKLDELKEKDELKIDAVVMIIPRGCKNLPKKLLNTIKQEAQRRDFDLPVFGVMTKMDKVDSDGDKSWRDLAREFCAELGIDGNFFVPLINYIYDDLLEERPDTNPNTDVPLLKILNQIYMTKTQKILLIGDELRMNKANKLMRMMGREKRIGCFLLVLTGVVLSLLAAGWS